MLHSARARTGLMVAAAVVVILAFVQLPVQNGLVSVALTLLNTIVFYDHAILLPGHVDVPLSGLFPLVAYARLDDVTALASVLGAAAFAWFRQMPGKRVLGSLAEVLVPLLVLDAISHFVPGPGRVPLLSSPLGLVVGLALYTTLSELIQGLPPFLRPPGMGRSDALCPPPNMIRILAATGGAAALILAFDSGGWKVLALTGLALLVWTAFSRELRQAQRSQLATSAGFSDLLEYQVRGSSGHGGRTGLLARRLAEAAGLPPLEVDAVTVAGYLHDTGETEVDRRAVSVMTRRAIPTMADQSAYREHPVLGAALAERLGFPQAALPIRHHHEAWDGTGYPDGLVGKAIPLGARILAAAELADDAGGSLEHRMMRVSNGSGTLLDPALVDHLQAVLPEVYGTAHRPEGSPRAAREATDTIRGSSLLETMGIGTFLTYRHGAFTDIAGAPAHPAAAARISMLARHCQRTRLLARDHFVLDDATHDLYCLPAADGSVSVLLLDLTKAVAAEREQLARIFSAYRDVMAAATHGKLMLMDEIQCAQIRSEGRLMAEMELQTPADGARARSVVKNLALAAGVPENLVFQAVLGTSEAVTNLFKHAGKGALAVRRHGSVFRVIVADSGDGIPYDILPSAVLMEGYSTKVSLGKGFTVMLKCADRVCLHTSPIGTVIVLEAKAEALSEFGEADAETRGSEREVAG